MLVSCPINSVAFVAIKMGRRQGARSGAYLTRYVTDEQRSRRPIFIATLRAVASWLFFRVARSTRMNQIWALRSRLEKQPTGRRRKPCYLWDRTLAPFLWHVADPGGYLSRYIRAGKIILGIASRHIFTVASDIHKGKQV